MKSAVTDYEDISAFSGAPAEAKHHLIFGRGLRDLADQDCLWIPILNREHNLSPNGNIHQIHGNPPAEKLSKMLGQAIWERDYVINNFSLSLGYEEIRKQTHEAFLKRYGRSYL